MPMSKDHQSLPLPPVSGTIERPRLLGKMQAVLEHRLTLITAPPGYGKTTLAAQFAQQLNRPLAWHTVEEWERDVTSLHTACQHALRSIVPDLSPPVSHSRSPNELATALTGELRETLRQHIVFVLDDLQNLAGSPSAESWLRAFVTYLPSRCHLILISRIIPDLPLTEMIARREVFAIGQRDLRFTVREVESLAYKIGKPTETHLDIEQVTQGLEGWPAGIILALQPLPSEFELVQGGKSPEALFDSLAGSMLRAQSSQLRNFLLRSSTLTRLTPELCAKILDISNSPYWFDEIQARGLFVSRTAGGLSYHSLFRSFLQRELKATDPALFAQLHQQAAQWFEASHRVEEAIEHFLRAEQADQANAIAERIAHAYHTQGRLETLLNWARQLRQFGAQAPRLYYISAMILTDRYEYDDATDYLQIAEHYFQQNNDMHGLVSVAIQHAAIHSVKGEYRQAAAQAAQIIGIEHLPPTLRSRALSILGYALLRTGSTERAVGYLEESLPLYRAESDAYALTQALQDLNVAYMQLGRLDDAGKCLQEIVALSRSLDSASAQAHALNNLGYYYHLRSNYAQASATFQEGLAVATRIVDRRAESYLLWSFGDIQRDRGAFEYALKLYSKGLELNGSGEPVVRTALLLSMATLKRWQREFDEAATLAEESYRIAATYDIALNRTMARILLWAVYAECGKARQALAHFAEAEAELESQGATLELLRLHALQANACVLTSEPEAAAQYLKKAAALAGESGSFQPFAAEVFHMPTLRHFVEKQRLAKQKDFALDLRAIEAAQIAALRQGRPNRRLSANITYSIHVTTFGREEVERDERIIATADWRAMAAREMFFYLLFMGPQSREDLCLYFWPDSSIKQVRSNFHTTLYRARQALGDNVIVFQDGFYMIDPELDLHCDALEMKDLARQARLMPARDARTEDLWYRAVQLYQGDFLPIIDSTWALPMRESYHEMYLEALIGLAECARARGDVIRALEMLKRASEVDPYREDIHRLIMTCYAQQGEKKKVVNQWNQLRQLLWDELALEPSPETASLAQALLG